LLNNQARAQALFNSGVIIMKVFTFKFPTYEKYVEKLNLAVMRQCDVVETEVGCVYKYFGELHILVNPKLLKEI
jgi:hypothetical protein